MPTPPPLDRRHASHYETLEVSRNASPEVIRAAYRSLMQRYHPDKNPGDSLAAARAVQVTQAYEMLSDAERRADYDRSLDGAAAAPSATPARTRMEGQRPRVAPKKTNASPILLLLAGALILLACWVLIAAIRQMSAPRAPSPAPREQPPASTPSSAQRSERNTTRKASERPAVRPPSQNIIPSSPQEDAPTVSGKTTPGAAHSVANREIPALIANLSIALRNPHNPGEATGYRLEIPAIAVRLGGEQTSSARNHLGNMAEPIREALETRLESADYDSLMTFDGDGYLARNILAVIAQVAGLPICAGDAGKSTDNTNDADDCYGLVAVRLPESYIVK